MIPEPDYNEDDRPNYRRIYNNFNNNNNNINENMKERLGGGGVVMDKEGLVVPRKPPNPCIASMERRDLHRELAFHQKTGKAVLNQKSELQRALQKQREVQSRKEVEKERLSTRSALEITLEKRAQRLEELERGFTTNESKQQPMSPESTNEFLRMHAKLRGRVERTAAMP
ncbi:hypothetical protein DAPPUDRAFT_322434 [Daphnia pulex]|uniref:Protein FAM107B n=1 Tax=Daphnia pulex TaxID=6669 RepID=E9GVY7_DAPPU|nr:hypothetical protein DAPPUDRAFT_322434 [Daphnia pulex]|eukprot:EFX76256.1 hypothetical protein DAPPUDRAFT_322434 [Daphnia pulex]